ncbi:MAG: PIG-L family deacetylase [Firmicutes bacterium]|nr:PIG-L family deacetylase [Bacillota bacterium]
MKKILALLLALVFVLSACPVYADGETRISSPEDLLKMKEDPTGSFVLTRSIDMTGIEWEPFEFRGTLDGNDYCIINVTVSKNPGTYRTVYDANLVEYQALCSGFFTVLEGATIKNLRLMGEEVSASGTESMFVGLLAGYAADTKVENVVLNGTASAQTTGHCFGTAGVFGFAKKVIINGCTIEPTLICIDDDPVYKEEQFMGGVYSFGYGDITNCIIRIDGYDSDHGYVHNGGLVGCFMHFDYDNYGYGEIYGNKIFGQISFYEDNEDRRAYCEATLGEIMDWPAALSNNRAEFARNEVYTYDIILGPHCYCGNKAESVLVAEPGHGDVGYKLTICDNCAYTHKYDFQLPIDGQVKNQAYQEWDDPLVGNTDLLVFSTHADDEQLFFAGVLPYYAQVRDLNVQVVYGTDHIYEPDRHNERRNGLWGVGITNTLDSSGWLDQYSETLDWALSNLYASDGIGMDEVVEWFRQTILKYKPKVIVTHDINGEYSHGQHMMIAEGLRRCVEQYSSEFPFLEKVYLHLWGENQISIDVIDERRAELNGLNAFQVTQKFGFTEHVSQHQWWFYDWLYYGNTYEQAPSDPNGITRAAQIQSYSPLKWGMIYGDPSLDQNKNDFFEGLKSYQEIADEEEAARKEAERKAEEERKEAERIAREEAEKKARLDKIKKIVIMSIGAVLLLFVLVVLILRAYNKNKKRRSKKK